MLRDPAHSLPGDAPTPDGGEETAPGDASILCAVCGHEVTRVALAMRKDGTHRHHCVNPLGIEFTVRLFSAAPGAMPAGPASARATWFAGYSWRLVGCAACREHLGWLYEGGDTPPSFFGLIADALKDY